MTIYRKILVSTAASAILAGALSASTLTIHDDKDAATGIGAAMSAPITKADTFFKSADYNITTLEAAPGTAEGTVKQIVYTPSVEINEDAVITLTITNGSLLGDNFYVTKEDGTTVMNFSTTGSVKNSANTGYTKLNFVALENIDANTDLIVSAESGSVKEPAIAGNKGLSAGSEVTIGVTKAIYQNGYDITNATTDANVTAKITQGYKVEADELPATSVVSVEQGRKEFKPETFNGYGSTTSNSNDTNASTSQSPVIKVSKLDSSLTVNKVELAVSTTGDCSAVTHIGVYPKGSTTELQASTEGNSTSCTWKFTENNANGTLFNTNGFEIAIDVNNSMVIGAPLTWTANLDVNDSEGGLQTLVKDLTTHKWTLDGAQFAVPSMSTFPGYGTYVLFTNTTAKNVNVKLDVYADKGANPGTPQATRTCNEEIALPVIPKNSTALYDPKTILDAIETKCPNFRTENTRFMGKFTVETPVGTVIPSAFQQDGQTGKRAVPVYKLDATAKDWRE